MTFRPERGRDHAPASARDRRRPRDPASTWTDDQLDGDVLARALKAIVEKEEARPRPPAASSSRRRRLEPGRSSSSPSTSAGREATFARLDQERGGQGTRRRARSRRRHDQAEGHAPGGGDGRSPVDRRAEEASQSMHSPNHTYADGVRFTRSADGDHGGEEEAARRAGSSPSSPRIAPLLRRLARTQRASSFPPARKAGVKVKTVAEARPDEAEDRSQGSVMV